MPHPELLRQDGDGAVPGEDRPQLAAGAGRLHLRQGKQTHKRASIRSENGSLATK